MEPLNDVDWYRLIQVIYEKKCILLLGPGVEFDPQTPDVPLTVKLAHQLAEQLGDADAAKHRDDLAYVAQIFRSKQDRYSLEKAVGDFYDDYAGRTTDVHRHLATLPFSLCIDITHGGFLASALNEMHKPLQQAFYWRHKEQPFPVVDITAAPPLIIYNLFGSCDQRASLLLTENDLLDFLVTVAKNKPPLPPYLTSRFSESQVSFLFLGFGFQHWYLRILLHVLKAHSRENISLALEDLDFFTHPDMPQTALFYDMQHRIQFRYASWLAFAKELCDRFRAEMQRRHPAPPQPVPLLDDAPVAFLCHCSDDAEAVADVSARLKALGVRPWVDQNNLRGGDLWDQVLHRAIEEGVNYFVVLETPAMLARKESYYYEEIHAALERQRKVRQGEKFIFPAQLEPCGGLTELDHLQRTDLTTPDGIKQLAAAILDDWARWREDRHE